MPYPVAAVRGKNFGTLSYSAKVLDTQATNLIGYWPMNETSGTTADNAEGTAARDGTFARNVTTMGTGVGIGDGNTAPLFDNVNDYLDLYSVSLRDVFSSTKGTAAIWVKVYEAAVWENAAWDIFMYLGADGNNTASLGKSSVNNTLQFLYKAGGTSEEVLLGSVSTTDWFHMAVTWDKTEDEVIAYYNGSQVGTTQSGLDTWVGNLINTSTLAGAFSTTPNLLTYGYLAHAAIWKIALTPAEVSTIGNP